MGFLQLIIIPTVYGKTTGVTITVAGTPTFFSSCGFVIIISYRHDLAGLTTHKFGFTNVSTVDSRYLEFQGTH